MKLPLILALVLSPCLAFAEDFQFGDLTIVDPVARETTPTAMSGAGFFTIINAGEDDDVLLDVKADFPRVMIHDTKVEDGVATMFHIHMLPVPAGETVTLKPKGKHVMFMGLKGDPLEVGEMIDATLVFEKAGEVDIQFAVKTMEEIMKP